VMGLWVLDKAKYGIAHFCFKNQNNTKKV